jgi:hypothetical protein
MNAVQSYLEALLGRENGLHGRPWILEPTALGSNPGTADCGVCESLGRLPKELHSCLICEASPLLCRVALGINKWGCFTTWMCLA